MAAVPQDVRRTKKKSNAADADNRNLLQRLWYRLRTFPPTLWWTWVFVPALVYVGVTRWPSSSADAASALDLQQRFWFTVPQQSDHYNCSVIRNVLDAAATCPDDDNNNNDNNDNNENLSSSSTFVWRSVPLRTGLRRIQVWQPSINNNNNNNNSSPQLVASVWREDVDLGRGYLLTSQAASLGRLWRWERGNGPIPLGRTLFLEAAGCRPDRPCATTTTKAASSSSSQEAAVVVGSGGLTLDFFQQDAATLGAVVLAEWGEGRIVRLEENGARTPLALLPPRTNTLTSRESVRRSSRSKQQELFPSHTKAPEGTWVRPTQLLMTATGDLLFFEATTGANDATATIYRVPGAMTVPPLASLRESRAAHDWTNLSTPAAQPWWQPPVHTATFTELGGMALWGSRRLVVSINVVPSTTASRRRGTAHSHACLLLETVSLHNDDDSEDDDEEEDDEPTKPDQFISLNLTSYDASLQRGGPMAVTNQGLVFLAVEQPARIVLLDVTLPEVYGWLPMPNNTSTITSLTLGTDSYLYVTTASELWRWKVRAKPWVVPTDRAPQKRPERTATTTTTTS